MWVVGFRGLCWVACQFGEDRPAYAVGVGVCKNTAFA